MDDIILQFCLIAFVLKFQFILITIQSFSFHSFDEKYNIYIIEYLYRNDGTMIV